MPVHFRALTMQVLLEAKAQLERILASKLEQASSSRNQDAVTRFTRLYVPLGLQVCCESHAGSLGIIPLGQSTCAGKPDTQDSHCCSDSVHIWLLVAPTNSEAASSIPSGICFPSCKALMLSKLPFILLLQLLLHAGLTIPVLQLQEKGLAQFTDYYKQQIGSSAEEAYNALIEATGRQG